MNWLAEGIEKILDLHRPEVVGVDGRNYSTRVLSKIETPTPLPINLQTLTGLVDYIKNNRDGLDLNSMTVHVEDYKSLQFFSPFAANNFCERAFVVNCEADVQQFPFERWMNVDEFNIKLMSMFTPAGDRDQLVKLMGNLCAETKLTLSDDGISQTVEGKTGVTTRGDITLSPIVDLAPFRTFAEVEQPMSKFLFRLRRDGQNVVSAALFEADGGAWRLQAMKNVAMFLGENLPKEVVVIA